MKKSILLPLLLLALFIALLPTAAFADMGPKPSITIAFENYDNRNFYITLIAPKDEWRGPWQALQDIPQEDVENWFLNETDLAIAQKFATFVDKDGYVASVEFAYCTEGQFRWGYFPPDPFKVLVYFENTDTFAVSDVCKQYAFTSAYKATIDLDNNSIQLSQNYNAFVDVIAFFARLLFTFAVEIGIAFAFGYRGQNQIGFIGAINALTQIALNVFLSLILFHYGSFAFIYYYVLAEFVVFAVEAIVFGIVLNKLGQKRSVWRNVGYAFTANLASLLLGLLVSFIFSLIPTIII